MSMEKRAQLTIAEVLDNEEYTENDDTQSTEKILTPKSIKFHSIKITRDLKHNLTKT